jgi:hypothetical protein
MDSLSGLQLFEPIPQSSQGPLFHLDAKACFTPSLHPSELSHRQHTPVTMYSQPEARPYNSAPYQPPVFNPYGYMNPPQCSPGSFGPHLLGPYQPTSPPSARNDLGVRSPASTLMTPISSPLPAALGPVRSGLGDGSIDAGRYDVVSAPASTHSRAQSRKRSLEQDDELDYHQFKRNRTTSTTSSILMQPMELSDEDTLLLKLKEDESLSWKDVASRFQSELGRAYQVPALQMRLKRLKERLRVWSENDVQALRQAHDYWLKNKWEIIASKVCSSSSFGTFH